MMPTKPIAQYTRADWFDHWLTQQLPDVAPLDAYRALAVALHTNLAEVGSKLYGDHPELFESGLVVRIIPTSEQLQAALKEA